MQEQFSSYNSFNPEHELVSSIKMKIISVNIIFTNPCCCNPIIQIYIKTEFISSENYFVGIDM